MTIQVAVLGIDGSGKSTLVRDLPRALASELGLVTYGVGDDLRLASPLRLVPLRVAPRSPAARLDREIRVAAETARLFKRAAKALTGLRRLYPVAKLLHLATQDHLARRVAAAGCDVVVTDGNMILSALGRAANYCRLPAPAGGRAETVAAWLSYLMEGSARAPRSAPPPSFALRALRALVVALRGLGLGAGFLPDVVLFLDASPEEAQRRLEARGAVDAHENPRDLAAARAGYAGVMAGVARVAPEVRTVAISVDHGSPADVLRAAVRALLPPQRCESVDPFVRRSA
jgi:thymidylate kinase